MEEEEEGEDEEKFIKFLSYLLINDRRRGLGWNREITLVINRLQQTIKQISQLVRRYGLFKGFQTGKHSAKSFEQKTLLKKCESIFFKNLASCKTISLIGSCYSNELIEVQNQEGKFIVTYVPLEGNLSLNYKMVSGSIFSIFRKQSKDSAPKEDFTQTGFSMVCAGYALYGLSTVLVLAPSTNAGLYEFILDASTNEFVMSNQKLEIPTQGYIYSMNEGRARTMDSIVLETIMKMKALHIAHGVPLISRYTGSIVADTHTIIKEGGLLISPPYDDFPQGLLFQQFFGNPLAFIVSEAGGAASNGEMPILNITVLEPHQSVPLYLGSVKVLSEFQRILLNLIKLNRINTTLNF